MQLDSIFLYPTNGKEAEKRSFTYCLGTGYIIAYVRQFGYSAEQFIAEGKSSVKELARRVVEKSASIVGFTVYYSNINQCLAMAKEIKYLAPETIIVFGGPSATTTAKDILLNYPDVDLCVRGEGEDVFLSLLKIAKSNGFSALRNSNIEINGISYRFNEQIIENPDSLVLINNSKIANCLDKYPSPFLENIIPAEMAASTGIISARGCNQSCTYCNCSVLSNYKLFLHSEERFVEEIKYISNKRPSDLIVIHDDAFTLVPARAKRISQKLIDYGVKANLSCITRCDYANKEMLELMNKAGFVSIGFSLESAVPRILKAIGKVGKPSYDETDDFSKEITFISKLKENVDHARNIGYLNVFASIMVGLPTETLEEAQLTIKTISELNLTTYMHNVLQIFPQTHLFKDNERFGYKLNKTGMNFETIHPIDAYSIPLEKNAHILSVIQESVQSSKRALLLYPVKSDDNDCFQNIILNSNDVSFDTIDWISKNISFNGQFIQIFSSRKEYELARKNQMINIGRSCMPTNKIYNYFISTNEKGIRILKLVKSFKTRFNSDQYFEIGLLGIDDVLKYKESLPLHYIGIDLKNDSSAELIQYYYDMIEKSAVSLDDVLNNMLSLTNFCNHANPYANYKVCNTALIDSHGEVKTCWNGETVGKIGDSFENINSASIKGCTCSQYQYCVDENFSKVLEKYLKLEILQQVNDGIKSYFVNKETS